MTEFCILLLVISVLFPAYMQIKSQQNKPLKTGGSTTQKIVAQNTEDAHPIVPKIFMNELENVITEQEKNESNTTN